MEFQSSSIENIFSGFDTERLVLPNFQRGFVWNRSKQQGLIASALVDLPVGNLLILQGHTDDFAKRPLCKQEEIEINPGACEYVLDGQQRLSTLRTVLNDVFDSGDWERTWESLYGYLRTRWFLKISEPGSEGDTFGLSYFELVNVYQYTDEEVSGAIEYKPVHKTKTADPYHPKFLEEDRASAVRYFEENSIVPLWEVCKKENGMHRTVLEKIARRQVSRLQDELGNGEYSKDAYLSVFQNYNSGGDTASDLYEEIEVQGKGEDREVRFATAFAELKQDWVKHIAFCLESIPKRKLAITQIDRKEIGRAVAIFEAINKGGQPLSVYDLLVAKSAPGLDRSSLSTRIKEIVHKPIRISRFQSKAYYADRREQDEDYALWSAHRMGIFLDNEPSSQLKEWFINVLSLIVHVKKYGQEPSVSMIKREKVLQMSTEDISENYELAAVSIIRALAFLQLRCGVIEAKNVSYNLIVVAIAFFFSDDDFWKDGQKIDRIEQWYWLSLFSGEYSKSQNDRCIDDIRIRLKDLVCCDDISEHKVYRSLRSSILNYDGYATKPILVRKDDVTESEPKSVQNSLLQFILSKGIPDFVPVSGNYRSLHAWDVSDGDFKLHKHHIVPLGSYKSIGESASSIRSDKSHILNSSLNLIYISDEANRAISDSPIESYLDEIDNFSGVLGGIPSLERVRDCVNREAYEEILEERYDKLVGSIAERLQSLN